MENLVNKLDSEEELRHIIERRYRSTSLDNLRFNLLYKWTWPCLPKFPTRKLGDPQTAGSLSRGQPVSSRKSEGILERDRATEAAANVLKLKYSFLLTKDVKRIEQDKMGFPNEAKRKTKDKAIQTEGSEPANKDFIMNL